MWLGADFPNLNIYTLGYPASFFAKWAKSELNIYERAKSALEMLSAFEVGKRPLVLVSHSLGGLLSKQLLRTASESTDEGWSNIAKSCQKVFFLATPHSGSSLATILRKLANGFNSSHVTLLQKDSTALDELNESFRTFAGRYPISTHVYYEAWPMAGVTLVVDKASADPGLTGVQAIGIDADHIKIATPKSRTAPLYVFVSRHIRDMLKSLAPSLEMDFVFERDAIDEYGQDRRDLLAKLIAGGREHEYALANDRQNRFARQYYRTGLIAHAKDAYDDLLTDVEQRFTTHIYHELICTGASHTQIATAVQEHVIDPLQTKYASGRASAGTIVDALYFLTERCHIRWDRP